MTRFDDRRQVQWVATGGAEKAYRAFNIDYAVQTVDMIDNGAWVGDWQKDAPYPGACYGMPTFSTELYGGADATTACALNELINACGMDVDVASGVATWHLGNLATEYVAADIKVNFDGLQWETNACVGDFKLTLEAGKFGIFDWKFRGNTIAAYAGGTEVALAAFTATGTPVVCDAFSLAVGPDGAAVASQVCNKVEIALNNVIDPRPDVNGTNGFSAPIITSRDPTIKFWVEASAIGTVNYESLFTTRGLIAYSFIYNPDGGVNKKCTFGGGGYISEMPKLSSLNGKLVYEVTVKQAPVGTLLNAVWLAA